MRKISIAIPTYNRYQQTIDSFAQVLRDDRVGEVVISDDASTDDSYERLFFRFYDNYKVVMSRNYKNRDCYFNKQQAMDLTAFEWTILLDSDNTITPDYLDAIYAIPEWDPKTIYQPVFASPHFDFRKWQGLTVTKENVAQYVDTDLMTALNAMNFFINREEYLKVWDGSVNPGTSDSIYFSYCWLASGRSIYMTPGLSYDHYISPNNDGHYQTHSRKYVEFHKSVMQKLRELR